MDSGTSSTNKEEELKLPIWYIRLNNNRNLYYDKEFFMLITSVISIPVIWGTVASILIYVYTFSQEKISFEIIMILSIFALVVSLVIVISLYKKYVSPYKLSKLNYLALLFFDIGFTIKKKVLVQELKTNINYDINDVKNVTGKILKELKDYRDTELIEEMTKFQFSIVKINSILNDIKNKKKKAIKVSDLLIYMANGIVDFKHLPVSGNFKDVSDLLENVENYKLNFIKAPINTFINLPTAPKFTVLLFIVILVTLLVPDSQKYVVFFPLFALIASNSR